MAQAAKMGVKQVHAVLMYEIAPKLQIKTA
jgi:hypothetical protein